MKLQRCLKFLQQCPDLSRLKTVRVTGKSSFRSTTAVFDAVMNKASVQFFETDDFWHAGKRFIQRLRGLAISAPYFSSGASGMFSQIHGQTLESLHVHADTGKARVRGQLSSLKELCLTWRAVSKSFDSILKHDLRSLQRVHFKQGQDRRVFPRDDTERVPYRRYFSKILETVRYIGLSCIGINQFTRADEQKEEFHLFCKELSASLKADVSSREMRQSITIEFRNSEKAGLRSRRGSRAWRHTIFANALEELADALERRYVEWRVVFTDF